MMYELNSVEENRLREAIVVGLATPYIDDIEDFVWEAVFCHLKQLTLQDTLKFTRKKTLFDVVDTVNSIGWSAKSLQWNITPECEFEYVIQRADIFKKSTVLGYGRLDITSHVDTLGAALLTHWHSKIETDAMIQKVEHKRVCILLKSKRRDRFVYFEDDLVQYAPEDLYWKWTDDTKTGLQGVRRSDGRVVYRWYPNQKQLFERIQLPPSARIFKLTSNRLSLDEYVNWMLLHLNKI